MTKIDIDQVRAMKTDELFNELAARRRHLFNLLSQAVTEKLEDPTLLGKARKEIARIMTVLRERGETHIEQRERHLHAQAAK